ncbi:response regulator [Cytobacillus firmus]|uniref:response regulator n=1 Tax=Cytobacillus firmus TaxID=1399 RepID=UPI00077C3206|nr:response regulator transcription factor [Cytobacillus firmus]MDD9311608.1 response regulator transcription factor [Cytobacillus firmus]MEC1895103.1 response regulator transcription factor [Cytobacillus firmus]MED1943069.1 response regulator transcription factor [Cytobacillus firmus]MED4448623.1 response regulator transcription factor [Cytobacillus firmus]MED4770157.1 response regulator transcription factor [Cytobacillus firmus]
MALKIAIADDHKLFREGVKRILEMEEDLEAAAEGEDGRDALIIDKNYKPDVMIMDIDMPNMNGIKATDKLNENQSKKQSYYFIFL